MTTPNITGDCAPGFKVLKTAFETNFKEHGEIGASLCIYQHGEKVVDLWGGHADTARTRPWEKDTLVNVWSTTKGMMALCVARLADQGKLEMGRAVADYWPEFAANGKENVTVAQLFSHQAGLCGTDTSITKDQVLNKDLLGEMLAAQKPQWPVGESSGYHAFSIGPLADTLFKKVIGQTVGEYFRDEIALPHNIDFHIGLPESEDDRVAEMAHDDNIPGGDPALFNPYQKIAIEHASLSPYLPNERAWRAQGTPSAAGCGNARSVAKIYSALATDRRLDDVEIVSEKALDAATEIQIDSADLVLLFPMSWGIGFAINKSMGAYGPSPKSFGHHGWGGSFGFADPDKGLGVAYAMNYMREPVDAPDPRFEAIIRGIYASV